MRDEPRPENEPTRPDCGVTVHTPDETTAQLDARRTFGSATSALVPFGTRFLPLVFTKAGGRVFSVTSPTQIDHSLLSGYVQFYTMVLVNERRAALTTRETSCTVMQM
jgi:hypothetical protein